MTAAVSPLAATLRRHDRDRYQLALFAPRERRDALFALYAFNYELARIRESVREPMMGLMRLQWWRDALDEIYAGAKPRRHEVVEPLAAAVAAFRPARAHFTALLDARARDMDEMPPESLGDLERYAAGSSGSLNQLVLDLLGVGDTNARAAAQAVGIAYALSGLLVAAPFHAHARRLYLPQELLARENVDLERSLFALKPSRELAAVAQTVARRAQTRLDEARRHRAILPRTALPALLPGVLAAQRLKRLARAGFDVMDRRLAAADTLQSLRLTWATLRGRF
ncbi:MAG TPA: phytoene/squalene synthase family protein [Stellaceae bacterium]|nr:phytoene/squalene synthase family protein [Stellaceae bacterium]